MAFHDLPRVCLPLVSSSLSPSQEHAAGTLLLAFRTGQLTRAHLEIRALALSYMQCEVLAARARQAIETAGQLWADAAAPLRYDCSIKSTAHRPPPTARRETHVHSHRPASVRPAGTLNHFRPWPAVLGAAARRWRLSKPN